MTVMKDATVEHWTIGTYKKALRGSYIQWFGRAKPFSFQDITTENTLGSAAGIQNACEFGMVILEDRAWHFCTLPVRRFFVEKVEALRKPAHGEREKMV